MNWISTAAKLHELYENFQMLAQPYTESAVCRPGCAFCCTHYGHLDITTLEGRVIRRQLQSFAKPRKAELRKKIYRNKRRKEKGQTADCPFLNRSRRCSIYAVRPFSCRQLYSVTLCGPQGPTLHREAVQLAKQTIKALQRLDPNGYSGHISYILYLLDQNDFRVLYDSGGFDPRRILDFGRSHGIVINRLSSK